MKRHILNTEATVLIDNRFTGARQTVKVQVISAGTIFVATQISDLQQLDATGAPVNGTRLKSTNTIEDGTYHDFLGVLYARSDIGVDIDVAIYNSPSQTPLTARKQQTTYTPWNAPPFGGS